MAQAPNPQHETADDALKDRTIWQETNDAFKSMTSDVFSHVTAKENPKSKQETVGRLKGKRDESIEKFEKTLTKLSDELVVKDNDSREAIRLGNSLLEQVKKEDLTAKEIANLNLGDYKRYQTLCSKKIRDLLQSYKKLKAN